MKAWLISIAVAAMALDASAQTPVATFHGPVIFTPQTPVIQALARYLQALNSGDEAKAAAFIAEHFPTSPIPAKPFAAFQSQVGGFQIVRIEESTPTVLTALAREVYGDSYARLRIEIEPKAPYRIVSLSARVTPRPADIAPPARLDDAALAQTIKAQLALMGDDFSGAVLVARRGKPIIEAVQGLADRERKLANTETTRFRVGSMDKMFTAVAVIQLIQAGKLDLKAPLGTYLKDYPNAEFARKVTLHHLLSHTGGAGDIFGPEYDANRETLRTPADYVRLYGARAPEFEPGSKYEYANYGFMLLGRVVEVVSGQSYYDYVQDHVFAPAGMTGSGFEPETVAVPDRARAYEKSVDDYAPASDLPWRGTPAGGGYSTTGDFLRFATALYDGRLLDRAHVQLLTSTKLAADPTMNYAYGFMNYPGAAPPMVGHSGGAPGMSGDLRIIGEGEGVIVVLSNVSPPFLSPRLGKFIAGRFSPR